MIVWINSSPDPYCAIMATSCEHIGILGYRIPADTGNIGSLRVSTDNMEKCTGFLVPYEYVSS
jgi:hypothetical protein